jgi:hypothetical protein
MKMINKKKNYFFQKIILVILVFSLSVFSFPQKTKAAVWPAVDPGIDMGLEAIYDTIQGIILGALKQASIMMLNKQLDALAGSGAGGEPAFITNWQDYLINQPEARVDVYMNDYLSQMTRGQNSVGGYLAEGFSSPNSYIGQISKEVENNSKKKIVKPTYEGNPSNMFLSGNFKNMDLYLSRANNNPWSFDANYQSERKKMLEEEKYLAQSRAIAYQGFAGTPGGKNPYTVTSPGILTKDAMANTQKMPADAITNARNIQEVIVAVVGQVVSKAIQQGFSSVQKKLQKAEDTQNRLNSNINSVMQNGNSGPGARFDY